MIAPRGEIGVRFYGEFVRPDGEGVIVKWTTGALQWIPSSYIIPADQPHELEFDWISEQLNRLQDEMADAKSKLQLACKHERTYKWASLERGLVNRCLACGKELQPIKEIKNESVSKPNPR